VKAQTTNDAANRIAEHKLLITRQQQILAELANKGDRRQARLERAKLFQLLDQFELMEASGQAGEQAAAPQLSSTDSIGN